VKVTALPDIRTQIVSGSVPTCSVVKPWVLVTLPGTVTGIGVPQVLPVVVRVMAVMVPPLVVKLRFGAHASRAMRLANDVAMSSCFRDWIGHFTLRWSARGVSAGIFAIWMRALQSDHLLDNDLYPDLQHGQLLRYAIDDCLACSHVVQIRLVEHEGVVVKPEKMSSVRCLLNSQQCIPIARGLRRVCVDPFKNCACGKLALDILA
jgi:hypothetical protein